MRLCARVTGEPKMNWIIGFFVLVFFLSVSAAVRKRRAADAPFRIKRDSWEEGPHSRGLTDTGQITEIAESTFCINPKSPFPLTLKNLSFSGATEVKKLLDSAAQHGGAREELAFFLAQHNIRCLEVDDWVGQLELEVRSYVEKKKQESAEWSSSSELDRSDLEGEFRRDALENLSTRPSSPFVLEPLLFGSPKNITADDALLDLFRENKELYRFYLTNVERGAKIQKIAFENDWYRKNCERLVALGVARRGKDIPITILLEQLRVKDINNYFSDRIDKPFFRKAAAIDFAVTQPDVIEVLSRHISFRDRFYILEPKEIETLDAADVDISDIRESYAYAEALAEVIRVTYVTGYRTLSTLKLAKGNDYDYWAIDAHDCCSSCSKLSGRKTKRIPPNLPPFHVGCSCQLDGFYNHG